MTLSEIEERVLQIHVELSVKLAEGLVCEQEKEQLSACHRSLPCPEVEVSAGRTAAAHGALDLLVPYQACGPLLLL